MILETWVSTQVTRLDKKASIAERTEAPKSDLFDFA